MTEEEDKNMKAENDNLRHEIISFLKEGICEVVFTKKNGDRRVMQATLMSSRLPPIDPSKERADKPAGRYGDQIRVFDVEAKSWRSFNVASLQSLSTEQDGQHVDMVFGPVNVSKDDVNE
jgi:hypothetical protein